MARLHVGGLASTCPTIVDMQWVDWRFFQVSSVLISRLTTIRLEKIWITAYVEPREEGRDRRRRGREGWVCPGRVRRVCKGLSLHNLFIQATDLRECVSLKNSDHCTSNHTSCCIWHGVIVVFQHTDSQPFAFVLFWVALRVHCLLLLLCVFTFQFQMFFLFLWLSLLATLAVSWINRGGW